MCERTYIIFLSGLFAKSPDATRNRIVLCARGIAYPPSPGGATKNERRRTTERGEKKKKAPYCCPKNLIWNAICPVAHPRVRIPVIRTIAGTNAQIYIYIRVCTRTPGTTRTRRKEPKIIIYILLRVEGGRPAVIPYGAPPERKSFTSPRERRRGRRATVSGPRAVRALRLRGARVFHERTARRLYCTDKYNFPVRLNVFPYANEIKELSIAEQTTRRKRRR